MAYSDFFSSLRATTKLCYGLPERSLDAQCLLPNEIGGKLLCTAQCGLFVCVRACACARVCNTSISPQGQYI